MTQLSVGPPFPVDGPVPVAPKSTLLDLATILTPSDDPHWMVGGQVRSYPPDLPQPWAPCNDGSAAAVKDSGGDIPQPRFGSFTAYLPAICNTWSSRPDDEFRTRLMAAFVASEHYAAEQQLVAGAGNPLNPFLGDTHAQVLNSGAATGYIEALSLLEQAIGRTARAGMVHADPATANSWAAYSMVKADTKGNLYTARGTPVVVGDGYIDARVQGHAAPGATTQWAFATGPVYIRRDAAEIVAGSLKESLDRATNTVEERAERNYLVYWDTVLQAAVLVNRAETN